MPLPHAFYPVVSKQGSADCAVAAISTYLRRDYAEVLIAAAHVAPHVWTSGLSCPEMVKVAKRLGVKAHWITSFDIEDAIGVLWVQYRDSNKQHVVVLVEGWVIDSEHSPVIIAWHEEYLAAHNAYANSLLQVIE